MGWETGAALSRVFEAGPLVESRPQASSVLDVRSQAPPCVLRGPPRSLVVPHLAEREHVVSTPPGPRAVDGVAAVPVPGPALIHEHVGRFFVVVDKFF